jgi:hypothetical protein
LNTGTTMDSPEPALGLPARTLDLVVFPGI